MEEKPEQTRVQRMNAERFSQSQEHIPKTNSILGIPVLKAVPDSLMDLQLASVFLYRQ